MTSPSCAAIVVFNAAAASCGGWPRLLGTPAACGSVAVTARTSGAAGCSYAEQCVRCYQALLTHCLRGVQLTLCILLLFDGFCRVLRKPILDQSSPPPRPLRNHDYQGLAPLHAERRRCLAWLGAALARAVKAARGHAVAAIPQNESQGAGIRPGERIGRAHHWQQLQRPVLVSTSAREAVPRASFQAREGLAVLVAEGRLDCGRRGVEQLHSYSAAPTAKRAKNKPWSWPSAPRH